ncbi:unnamed protein product, partial [Calicophoron daubneyi]
MYEPGEFSTDEEEMRQYTTRTNIQMQTGKDTYTVVYVEVSPQLEKSEKETTTELTEQANEKYIQATYAELTTSEKTQSQTTSAEQRKTQAQTKGPETTKSTINTLPTTQLNTPIIEATQIHRTTTKSTKNPSRINNARYTSPEGQKKGRPTQFTEITKQHTILHKPIDKADLLTQTTLQTQTHTTSTTTSEPDTTHTLAQTTLIKLTPQTPLIEVTKQHTILHKPIDKADLLTQTTLQTTDHIHTTTSFAPYTNEYATQTTTLKHTPLIEVTKQHTILHKPIDKADLLTQTTLPTHTNITNTTKFTPDTTHTLAQTTLIKLTPQTPLIEVTKQHTILHKPIDKADLLTQTTLPTTNHIRSTTSFAPYTNEYSTQTTNLKHTPLIEVTKQHTILHKPIDKADLLTQTALHTTNHIRTTTSFAPYTNEYSTQTTTLKHTPLIEVTKQHTILHKPIDKADLLTQTTLPTHTNI